MHPTTANPIWTYFLTPGVTLLVASVSVTLILWQIRLSRRTLLSSTILATERDFWENYRATYQKVEYGFYEGRSLRDLQDEELLEFEAYLNFFNTLGVLAKLKTINRTVVLATIRHRLSGVLSLELTEELLTKNQGAWDGVCYFNEMLSGDAPGLLMQSREVRALRRSRPTKTDLESPPLPDPDAANQKGPPTGESPTEPQETPRPDPRKRRSDRR